MRHDVMMSMTLDELDRYGGFCGIDVTGIDSREGKVAEIEGRRGRVAELRALGTTLSVPSKRLHDKRVSDILNARRPLSNAEVAEVMTLILGEEQYAEVIDRCTDEDGTVDIEAIASVYFTLARSAELKNY